MSWFAKISYWHSNQTEAVNHRIYISAPEKAIFRQISFGTWEWMEPLAEWKTLRGAESACDRLGLLHNGRRADPWPPPRQNYKKWQHAGVFSEGVPAASLLLLACETVVGERNKEERKKTTSTAAKRQPPPHKDASLWVSAFNCFLTLSADENERDSMARRKCVYTKIKIHYGQVVCGQRGKRECRAGFWARLLGPIFQCCGLSFVQLRRQIWFFWWGTSTAYFHLNGDYFMTQLWHDAQWMSQCIEGHDHEMSTMSDVCDFSCSLLVFCAQSG